MREAETDTMTDGSAGFTVTNLATPATAGGGRPAPTTSDGEPSRIGKYKIVKLLGKGGMGAVYQAHDPLLDREVAIKVMLPTIAEDPELTQRFEREARAVARLTHPSVVTLFDLGYHTDGSPYIVMELLRGRDLVDVMRQGPPLSLDRKLSIVVQVLDGLGHAHELGIVHRDVKPANVFLTDGGSAKIMDFGIARFMSAGGTGTGSVLGTASYMSPEQVRGDRVDGRSDLFSVGTLLCELLAGRRPFDADTPVATLYRIANGEPRFDLPPGPEYGRFEPVLRRALARSPADRYATAAEFAEALHCLVDRGAPAARAPEATTAASDPTAPGPAPLPARRADPCELFRLLREIHVGGRSGQLHITATRRRRSLRVLRGQILHGTSDVPGEHLGDILVQRGRLSQAELERALAVVLGERRRLGAVLVEEGLLDKARLEEAIGLHSQAIVFNALDSADVSFAFEDLSEDVLETDLVCPLSTGQVILDATRRLVDPELVRRVLGDTRSTLRVSADPLLRAQKITLTSADGFVLSRIDGTLSAREVVALIPLPTEDCERSLFSLLCTGFVEYGERQDARRTPARTPLPVNGGTATTASATTTARPAPTPAPTAPATPRPSAGAAGRSTEEIRLLILATHSDLKRDHFEVLGLERSATEADVREAYGRLARVLHPDVRLDPALDDLRERREKAFIRVSQACETLRDPEARARYEQAFPPRRFRPPAAATTPIPTPEPTPAPVVPAAPDPPQPTAAPMPAAAPAVGGIDPRLEPEHILAVARDLFGSERYWDAIQQLEPLVARPGNPVRTEARMLLAQAYLKNPLWKRRAETVLQGVLAASPDHVPALLLMAEIYVEGRLLSRAGGLYRRVLELSPRHRQASRGLAALEADAAAPGADGLRRLFRVR
jgi:serine/threonine protein kinase